MCVTLRLIDLELRKVRWKKHPSVDARDSLLASVQVEGLRHVPTVRPAGREYRIVTGEHLIKCIAALVEAEATCFDRCSGQWITAREIYRRIPAWLVELERSEEAHRVPTKERELEMLTYVVAARSLGPPVDGLRMANEVVGLEEDLSNLFPRQKGYPTPRDLSRRLSRLNSAQIDALMQPCAFPDQHPPAERRA
jgi:hypothetical protein